MDEIKRLLSKIRHYNHQHLLKVIVFVSLSFILFFSMLSNIQPEVLDLRLFSQAEKDILSPITVEDEEATIQKKQDALARVEDQYMLKNEYAQNRIELITALFEAVEEVNRTTEIEVEDSGEESKQIVNESLQQFKVSEDKSEIKNVTVEEKLELLKANIPSDFKEEIREDVFKSFLLATPEQLDAAKNTVITSVRNVMNDKIKIGDEDLKKLEVAKQISNVNVSTNLRDSMIRVAEHAIIPNYVYDIKGTEIKRQQAIDEVVPVIIRTGQVLVKEGQIIDREIYRHLEIVGLLDEESNAFPYIGLALFIFICIGLLAYYFEEVKSPVRSQHTYLFIYFIIVSITIILMKVISLFQQFYADIGYVVPVAMATILIKMLINDRMAILTSIILAFCGSIIFNNEVLGSFNYTIGLYFFFSSIAGVVFLNKQNHRLIILKAGLFVSIVNMIMTITLVMLMNGQYSSLDIGIYILLAFISGITSAILTLGLMPFFEAGFGMLSTMKLIELASPNHPLLRKILTETPGTYHHSIMVGNLSEAACEAIGADGFLARVGSYYHDLGKTRRPHFFIENQMNMENPHDKIAPQLSKTIITSHPYDGAELLRDYKMPKEIVDIAEQHHGTTLLKYFYHKAKETDPNVTETDFRYPGPKAQTKESAIVGIADSVEAAVRSLRNPTPHKIENLVRSIISDRLQDGQFDECDLTLKELDVAAKSMCETLKGIFHSRIEYPEVVKKKVKEA